MFQSSGEKETGKAGAEFPPDPLSTPASFRSRSLEENRRDDLPISLGRHRGWMESLWQIFFKKSSNFVQKAQPPCALSKVTNFPIFNESLNTYINNE